MASVIKVGSKWRAQVRRRGFAPQCRTFTAKAQAEAWARQVEASIDAGTQPAAHDQRLTIGEVIRAYRRLREQARPISDSSNEHYMLKKLEAGLGHLMLYGATPDDLVGYATMRRDEDGAGPYTINMDVSKLGTVLRYGCAALRVTPPDLVGGARPLLAHLRLIGGGGKRERRPQDDEFVRLTEHIEAKFGRIYAEAVRFAAASSMRRGEVCAITREAIDRKTRTVPVWRKHPRKGKVLETVPLLGQAWVIAERQPKSEDGRLFPIHPQTLSKYFRQACADLSIVDLRLHDMRHECTSAMFEAGMQIQEVALVTGHKDWRNLKRYTNLRPEDLTRPEIASDQGKPRRRGSRRSAGSPPGKS